MNPAAAKWVWEWAHREMLRHPEVEQRGMKAQAIIRHNENLPRDYQGDRKWQMEVLSKDGERYLLWSFGCSVQQLFDKFVAPKSTGYRVNRDGTTVEVIP